MTRLGNRFVSALPPKDHRRFIARCESCRFEIWQVLSEVGQPAMHVYFPLDAIVAMVAVTKEGDRLGLAIIGREGLVGLEVALGILDHPVGVVVQGAGSALRMSVDILEQELLHSASLRTHMQSYAGITMQQVSRSAACAKFHEIRPRLARWLLMSQDRLRSASFHITHEFLGQMLGVRRVGITTAASELQRDGLIRYHRGEVVVLDRVRLKAVACSCYAEDYSAWLQTNAP